jgi:hypothetical protein
MMELTIHPIAPNMASKSVQSADSLTWLWCGLMPSAESVNKGRTNMNRNTTRMIYRPISPGCYISTVRMETYV